MIARMERGARPAALAVAALAAVCALCGSAGSAVGKDSVRVYTVATGVEFINTADDRARGAINNPFSAETNKLRPEVSEKGNGPFPGDVAVYSFDIYGSPKLHTPVGTASYTCYFNYERRALCIAYYELKGGSTLVASGPIDFNNGGFKMVLTGGTGKYIGSSGEVTAVPAARNAQRVDLVRLPAPARTRRQRLTTYALPSTAQFMNHADDRVRGMTTNPFNAKSKGLVIIAKGSEKQGGPFPGDDILYTFGLSSSPKPAGRHGAALFTCYYNFVKRAVCDSYFELDGGVVLASGPVAFNSTKFTLGVTGGTGKYAGVAGQVTAVPAAGNAERLDLLLLEAAK
jgi:hypothetical protein